ncbi:Tape measure protein [Furfurilactobacillus rossiae]|uniref:tape measure protein n=1 Tax=Furfurilactobacillus rossiae TaxID=231049 RepID=UPI0015B7C4B4|nr:tape measure protein [Furfurilactobacillus rossiae]QLE64015.1 Tape measure protein [Furfurilactobacillus rossiae]
MAADGTVDIDVLLNDKFTPDWQHIMNLVKNGGSDAGDKMDSAFNANADKMVGQAEQAHNKVKTRLNQPVSQKVKADISEFDTSMSRVERRKRKLDGSVMFHLKSNISDFLAKASQVRQEKRSLQKTIKPKIELNDSGIQSHLNGIKKQLASINESKNHLKDIALGSFIGNAAANAWGMVTSSVKGALGAVIAYNDKQQVMNATWKTLTGSVSDGKAMVGMVNDMSTALGQDVDVTDELAQQFYHVYDNKPDTERLTKSFLIMGDAIGLSGDRLKQVGMDFTHTMSSGMMQVGDFNQITDAFPMYGEALLKYEQSVQKNSKLTMGELRNQMSAGKISAQDAATVFNSLGDKYQASADNLMQTLPGMARKMKTQIPNLLNDMLEPIMKARNPIVGKISEWTSDPKTVTEFKSLGTRVTRGMQGVTDAFNKQLGAGGVDKFFDGAVQKLGDGIVGTLDWIAKHADDIKETAKGIGSITKDLAKGFWSGFKGTIQTIAGAFNKMTGHAADSGGAMDSVAGAIQSIASHHKEIEEIGKAIGTYFVVSKVAGFASKLWDISSSLWKIVSVPAGTLKTIFSVFRGNYSGESGILQSISGKFSKKAKVSVEPEVDSKALLSESNMSSVSSSGHSLGKRMGRSIITGLKAAGIAAALINLMPSQDELNKKLKELKGGSEAKGRRDNGIKGVKVPEWWQKLSNHGSMGKWWTDEQVLDHSKPSSRTKKTTTKEAIKEVATTHVSKTDIANVKLMTAAIKKYDSALSSLKAITKKNDPTKELNSMNKRLKSSINDWKKLASPIKKVGDAFKGLSSFQKSMGKKDSFKSFSKDLSSLEKTLKKSKIGTELKKLKSELTKNDPSKILARINKSLTKDTKNWKNLAKPITSVKNAMSKLDSEMKKMGKVNPFSKLNKDMKNFDRTASHAKFGHQLSNEVTIANKAMGNTGFVKVFHSMTKSINSDLRSFSRTFKRDWRSLWNDAYDMLDNSNGKQDKAFRSHSSTMRSIQEKFESSFNKSWRGWLNYVVDTFTSAFNKLPKAAHSSMSKVMDSISSGVKSLNGVIAEFGGDKKLSMPKFATGTSGRDQGGLAVVGEEGFELAHDNDHGIYPVGLHGEEMRYLPEGTSILPHALSVQFASLTAGLPHHKDGKGDFMSDIMDHMDDVIKDPLKYMKEAFFKTAKFSGNDFVTDFGPALSNGFLKAIQAPFKKMAETSDMPAPGGSGVERWRDQVKRALEMLHLSTSLVNRVLKQIQTESGGNEHAKQHGADPDGDGSGPALGLMQTKMATFLAHAFPGHKNIWNGFDDILAGLDYARKKYGDSLSFLGQGHGYANGGWAKVASIFGETPGEPEVAINPARPSADKLIMQAARARIAKAPDGVVAKSYRAMKAAQAGLSRMQGTLSTGHASQVAMAGGPTQPSIDGNVTLNWVADGKTIASITHSAEKVFQQKDITISAKREGLH